MSSQLRRLRRSREIDPDADYCVQMGATQGSDPDDIEQAKKETHDMCIRLAGPYRRSGITWSIHHGEHAQALLDRAAEMWASEPHDRDVCHKLKAWLRTYPEGRLVIASCKVAAGAPTPGARGLVEP